jgi:hypothetical protein
MKKQHAVMAVLALIAKDQAAREERATARRLQGACGESRVPCTVR